jgi:cellulose synthase/poly-beta-1,6-N-acetylglucosamine synthase-like glycosyltransferase
MLNSFLANKYYMKSIVVGICAYNEEASIEGVLKALSFQKENNYVLKRVVLVSDGSMDKTVAVSKKLHWKKLTIINGRSRLGKPARLNMLFRQIKSDILITIDADVVIKDSNFIEKIVREFSRKSVMFVSANATPLRGSSMLESAVGSYYRGREYFGDNFDYTNCAFGFRGTALGFRKEFYQKLHIPTDIVNDDAYCYFVCKQRNHDARQAKRAIVYFKSPDSLSDFISQHERYIFGGGQIRSRLPEELVDRYSWMPLGFRLRVALYQLISDPIAYFLFKSVFAYLHFRSHIRSANYFVSWSMILSSKPGESVSYS